MMDFASTTQAELEAERGELQVSDSQAVNLAFACVIRVTDETFYGGDGA